MDGTLSADVKSEDGSPKTSPSSRSRWKQSIRRALSLIPPIARQFGRSDRLAYFERFCPLDHYYSPISNIEELRCEEDRLFASRSADLPGIDLQPQGHRDLIRAFADFAADAKWQENDSPGLRYRFDNTHFTRADALTLYSMLRFLKPKRFIEVGSGWSSCVTLDTVDSHLGGLNNLACLFIDPDPSRLTARLLPGDKERVKIRPKRVQDVDPKLFQELDSGDILFIDSSHVAKTGSDVNYLYFEIIPMLRRGVHIHIHDVFFPFEYPQKWIYDGRNWNEAYIVRAMLVLNAAFKITWFGDYAARFLRDEMEQMVPQFLNSPAQSLWLQTV